MVVRNIEPAHEAELHQGAGNAAGQSVVRKVQQLQTTQFRETVGKGISQLVPAEVQNNEVLQVSKLCRYDPIKLVVA